MTTTRMQGVWERASWWSLLAACAAAALAVAKVPLRADAAPVFDRFAGPEFAMLALLVGASLVFWCISWLTGGTAPRVTGAHAAAGLFCIAVAASVAFSRIPMLALTGESGRYLGGIAWVLLIACFFLASQLVTGTVRLRSLAWVFIGVGLVQAVLSLSQVAGFDIMRYSFAESALWMLSQGVGTLGSPNQLASVLVVPLVLAAGEALFASDTARRVAAGVSAFVITAAIVASATRAAWIGAAVGLMLLGYIALRAMRADARTAGLVFAAVGLAVVAGVMVADPAILGTRFAVSGDAAPAVEQVSNGRLVLWRQSVEVFSDSPIVGIGPDSLRNEWKAQGLRAGPIGVFIEDTHNFVILLFVSFGVVGAVVFAAMVALALAGPLKRLAGAGGPAGSGPYLSHVWLAALLAVGATSLVSVLSIPMLVAMAVALGAVHAPYATRRSDSVKAWGRALALAGSVALVLVALWASFVPLYHNVRLTYAGLTVPLSPAAIEALDASQAAQPWRYDFMIRRVNTLMEQGAVEYREGRNAGGEGRERLDALIAEVDRTAEDEPDEYYAWVFRVRAYTLIGNELGDPALASRAVELANEALVRFPDDEELEFARDLAQQLR